MGKVKRQRNKAKRDNPIGGSLSSENGLEGNGHAKEISANISPFVESILEQLQSSSVEERDSGLNSISQACSNPELLDQFLKNNVLKIAFTLFEDKSPIVRHSVAGALRNISTVGSAVCSLMITDGILPHLVNLFKQNYSDWKPKHKGQPISAFKIDTVVETYIEAVNLLLNLCESSGSALKVFNKENLVKFLVPCLNTKEFGIRVALAAGQCLSTVSEDNRDIVNGVEEFESFLQQILSCSHDEAESSKAEWAYLKVLASGILLNLTEQVSNCPPSFIALATDAVFEMLSIDHVERLNTFSSEIPLQRDEDFAVSINKSQSVAPTNLTNAENNADRIHSLEISSSNIRTLLNGQIAALEILSNLVFTDADDDEDDSTLEDSEEEFMEADGGNEEIEEMDDFLLPSVIPEVYEAVVSKQLLNRVLDKIRKLPANVSQIFSENPEYGKCIFKSYSHLRCRALLCLQNLILGLDLKDIDAAVETYKVWISLRSTLEQEILGDISDNSETVEAITSALRALALKWADEKDASSLYQNLQMTAIGESDFKMLWDVYNRVKLAKIHTSIIKIIGGIGILLSRKPKAEHTIEVEVQLEHIGEFLLHCITSYGDSQHLWRVSESLDTIFDVFAEDDYNHILKKLGMIQKLKLFLPQFKKNIKNERRRLGENKAIIETAKTNLSRFIEYKVKNGCA